MAAKLNQFNALLISFFFGKLAPLVLNGIELSDFPYLHSQQVCVF